MSGAPIEHHIKAVFTLKSYADGSDKEIILTSVQESDAENISYPLLKKIGAVGVTLGDFLPIPATTSITIYDEPGSIGFERRFTDLLQRYAITNQKVSIYFCSCAVGEFDPDDYELQWVGTVTRSRPRGDELTIQIAGRGIEDRTINTRITTELFPNAPSGSLGYALPVIIGEDVQVKPVLINETNPESLEYAYGTNMVDYLCGGIQKILAKAHDNKHVEVQSPASTTTPIYGTAYNPGVSPYGTTTPYYEFEFAERFTAGSAGYIITGASFWVNKLSGAADGFIELAIAIDDLYQTGSSANWGRAPGTVLGSANYELALLSSSAGNYEIRVNFPNPIVIKPFQSWFFCHKKTGETTAKLQFLFNGAGSNSYFYKNTSLWLEASGDDPFWCLYGAKIYNTPPTSLSRFAGITIDQRGDLDEVPDLTKLDLILEVDGLKDDGSGTVTGSASSVITSPQHATELLTKTFNGTTYTGGQFGSEHSDTWPQVNNNTSAYYRKLSSKTSGSTQLSSFLEQICRATASRITMHPHETTPMGFWAWGAESDPVDLITHENCRLIGLEVLGTETIINQVELFYAEKIIDLDYVTGNALGEFKNFSAMFSSLDESKSSFDEAERVSAISREIFGAMELRVKTQSWLADEQSVRSLSLSLLRRYGRPLVFAEIEAPLHMFKQRKILDVVNFRHPQIPTFFGSSPKANKPTFEGAEVDISTGFYYPRARAPRARIEGRQIISDSISNPKMRFLLQILDNPHDIN